MAGFTTVRDLGTTDGVALSLRDAIAKGLVSGPRVYAAGKSDRHHRRPRRSRATASTPR